MTLTVDGIYKRFGRFPALTGVSLEVRDGEFLTLLGPSGWGKTHLTAGPGRSGQAGPGPRVRPIGHKVVEFGAQSALDSPQCLASRV